MPLKVKPGTTPKFFKPLPVPLALWKTLEVEIDWLVACNVLVPVDHSEWDTPVVPIMKGDGTVKTLR